MTQNLMSNKLAGSTQTAVQAQETSMNSRHPSSGDSFFDAEIDYMLYQASSLKDNQRHESENRKKSGADTWRHRL